MAHRHNGGYSRALEIEAPPQWAVVGRATAEHLYLAHRQAARVQIIEAQHRPLRGERRLWPFLADHCAVHEDRAQAAMARRRRPGTVEITACDQRATVRR